MKHLSKAPLLLLFFLLPFTVYSTIQVISVTPINTPCSGAVEIEATGTAGPFTFKWTGPSGFSSTSQNLSGLCDHGIYTVKVLFAGSDCFATLSVTVVQCENIIVTETIGPLCAPGNNDAFIDISASGGTIPYNYQWNNGATTEDLYNIPAGTYCLSITDTYGCKSDPICFSPTTVQPLVLSLNGNPISPSCTGSGVLSASIQGGKPPFSFSWSTGQTTNSINVGITNYYSVTVTDACNTSKVASIYYPVSRTMSLDFIRLCDVIGVDLTVSGGATPFTYLWMWSNDPQWTESTEDLAGINPSGIYSISVTDAIGCTKTGSVTGVPLLTVSGAVFNSSFGNCADGAINLTVTNGSNPYEYKWSGPNGYSSLDKNINNLRAGQYCVTVTDASACSSTKCFNIINSTQIGISSIQNILSCSSPINNSGSIQLTKSGVQIPLTYYWSGPNGYHSPDMNISNLEFGYYSVTITSASGCTQVLNANISCCTNIPGNETIPPISAINLTSMTIPPPTGSLDISVVGGSGSLYYLWSNGSTEQDVSGLNFFGTYCVTVTDGCSSNTNCFHIRQCASLQAITNVWDNCIGFTSGKIFLYPSGGNHTYSYVWSNGAISKDLENLTEGTYTVTITDFVGCSIVKSATVGTKPPAVSYNSYVCEKRVRCGNDVQIQTGFFDRIWDGCNRVTVYCSITNQIVQGPFNVPFGTGTTDIFLDPIDCALSCQQSSSPTNIGTPSGQTHQISRGCEYVGYLSCKNNLPWKADTTHLTV